MIRQQSGEDVLTLTERITHNQHQRDREVGGNDGFLQLLLKLEIWESGNFVVIHVP